MTPRSTRIVDADLDDSKIDARTESTPIPSEQGILTAILNVKK